MGPQHPLPSWLGDPTAMPASFSLAAAWSRLAQAGRPPSSLGAGVGLAIIASTLMSVTSSPRDTRYLQQTCAWHLAANPGINGCEEGGRWSPARLGPPGCSAAHGPGTLWVTRDPWGHQSRWVPCEATSKDYPAAPRGIPTRDVPWVINPSGAPGKAPVLSDDLRELGSVPCFPRQPFPIAGRAFSGNPVTSMSGLSPCKKEGCSYPSGLGGSAQIAGPGGTSKPSRA